MRFSLLPRETKFFDMFEQAAATVKRAADKFLAMLTEFNQVEQWSEDLKKEEDICDEIIGGIIQALDRSFITPIDREDIHTLATTLDDVMDNMEETAHRFHSFRVDKPTPEAVALARIIQECCGHLEQAIHGCRSLKKPEEIQSHLREIGRLENEADELYRDTDGALFANGAADILTLIKWRELYAWLEETVDACKDVSQVISEIVVKGS